MEPKPGDALIVVDVQNDFLPGGSLGVPDGDQVVPVLNRYIERFSSASLPVVATRDWHPAGHCSFTARGGPWPPHCIEGTPGAEFSAGLKLPDQAMIVSKGTDLDRDAYSGFQDTGLAAALRKRNVSRVYIGGLATDYCVVSTVRDAVQEGFDAVYLRDACRAVNVKPDDGSAAEREIAGLGVPAVEFSDLSKA